MRFWFTTAAVLLVGGSLAYLGWQWGMRWLIDCYLDDPMRPSAPIQKFTGFDPALRDRTATRRQAADKIRTRAAHVETGARVADVLRLVK